MCIRDRLDSEREILRYVMAIVPRADDAREIFQETAVALWKQIEKYDPSQPFTPWACRFAANKAKEYLRKQGRWKGFLDEDIATALLARREQLAPELDRRVGPLRDCLREMPDEIQALIISREIWNRKYPHFWIRIFEQRNVFAGNVCTVQIQPAEIV